LPSLAGRSLIVVACSVPPLSRVPRALTHLPCVIASGVAVVSFEYLVLSSTVTAVCVVLPLASVPATVMVLPVTEATEPRSGFGLAGAGEPGGGVLVVEPCPDCLAGGQVPLTEGLSRTDAAVAGCPPWISWVGRTVIQLPEVTSLSVAGATSVTLVVEVKFTAALVLSSLVTWIELPATDAIRPLTCASPCAGAGDVVVDVTVDVEVDVVEGLELFDEPHAATDKAVAPVAARMASRVRRGV
jgi:hypothetical protein